MWSAAHYQAARDPLVGNGPWELGTAGIDNHLY